MSAPLRVKIARLEHRIKDHEAALLQCLTSESTLKLYGGPSMAGIAARRLDEINRIVTGTGVVHAGGADNTEGKEH